MQRLDKYFIQWK